MKKYISYTKWYWYKVPDRVAMKVAWRLPKRVVKWCYVRVGAHATTGKYGNTVVPDITMMDALQRWDD